MRAYKVTVTDAVTLLIDADNKNRSVYVHVVGNKKVSLGNASVTYADGMLLEKHTAPIEIFLPQGEKLYAICHTAETDDVRVMTPDAD